MSIINMSKNIKKIHPYAVICYKAGTFYQCFGKDAYIISYLFGYKINEYKNETIYCGFPTRALSKIMTKLENKKIDYLILEPRNNYDVDYSYSNGNLNEFTRIAQKSKNYFKVSNRIDKFSEELKKRIDEKQINQTIEKIRKIEEIVYETGKI